MQQAKNNLITELYDGLFIEPLLTFYPRIRE